MSPEKAGRFQRTSRAPGEGPWAASAEAQTRLRLPFDDPKGSLFLRQPIVHVDHDLVDKPLTVECINYKGVAFPWCYDEHHGTDFLLKSGFGTMDANDVRVVADMEGATIMVGRFLPARMPGVAMASAQPMLPFKILVSVLDKTDRFVELVVRCHFRLLALLVVFEDVPRC